MPPNNRNRAHVVPTTAIRQKQQQQHPSQKSSMPPSRGGNVAVQQQQQKQQRPQDNNVSDKEKEVLRIFIPYFLADLKKSYETAVTIYKECKIKHEKRQQGYESLTAVMKVRLETDLLGKDQFKRKFGEFCKKHQTLLQQKLGNADPSTRGKEALRLFIPYFLQDLKKQYEGAVKIHRECKEKNERQEPGYESLTVAMKRRLGELVGKDALKQKFRNFVEKYKSKLQEKLGKGSSSSSNNKGVSVPAPAQAPAVIPVAPSQLTTKKLTIVDKVLQVVRQARRLLAKDRHPRKHPSQRHPRKLLDLLRPLEHRANLQQHQRPQHQSQPRQNKRCNPNLLNRRMPLLASIRN